jgi:hypothetical protein
MERPNGNLQDLKKIVLRCHKILPLMPGSLRYLRPANASHVTRQASELPRHRLPRTG